MSDLYQNDYYALYITFKNIESALEGFVEDNKLFKSIMERLKELNVKDESKNLQSLITYILTKIQESESFYRNIQEQFV